MCNSFFTWSHIGSFCNKLALFLLTFALAGCASTSTFRVADEPPERGDAVRVLLMEPDVQLSELTASGMEEPRADWTATARTNVSKALTEVLKESQDTLVHYEPPDQDFAELQLQNQLVKLHEAVGQTILLHSYAPTHKLPTKTDGFDWSLGSGTRRLLTASGCEYALFIYIRDSYTSAGRMATIIAAAILGVGIQGGQQTGFASLIDLHTGQLVWFNRLSRGTGDLRTAEVAREAVMELISQIPL